MMTRAASTKRAIPINRVDATGRVPFGWMPLTAATAAMMTARVSHASHVMTRMLPRCGPTESTLLRSLHPSEAAAVSSSTATPVAQHHLALAIVTGRHRRDGPSLARESLRLETLWSER